MAFYIPSCPDAGCSAPGFASSSPPLPLGSEAPTLAHFGLPQTQLPCVTPQTSRSCPGEIILLVWRMVPQIKPGPDGGVLRRASCKSAHDLPSPPNKREKNCTHHGAQARPEQRHSCHLVCDSSDGLLLGGWERYTEVTKRGGQHTLPALSRATAPTDPNYIILAPLNPGSQVWTGEEYGVPVGGGTSGRLKIVLRGASARGWGH